ncbi:MAG: response regulator [bacterium]|nr:response regulator [bacterium]
MKDNGMIRVLAVDDEPSIRNSLGQFLEDYDFDVITASSAEEALELLAKQVFDVAVVDLRLPEMNGDAMILEAHKRHPTLRFIIHTGSTNFRITDELTAIGMQQKFILLKPQPDLNVIVDAINELMTEND